MHSGNQPSDHVDYETKIPIILANPVTCPIRHSSEISTPAIPGIDNSLPFVRSILLDYGRLVMKWCRLKQHRVTSNSSSWSTGRPRLHILTHEHKHNTHTYTVLSVRYGMGMCIYIQGVNNANTFDSKISNWHWRRY